MKYLAKLKLFVLKFLSVEISSLAYEYSSHKTAPTFYPVLFVLKRLGKWGRVEGKYFVLNVN